MVLGVIHNHAGRGNFPCPGCLSNISQELKENETSEAPKDSDLDDDSISELSAHSDKEDSDDVADEKTEVPNLRKRTKKSAAAKI